MKSRLRKIHQIHFVDNHDYLLDSEQTEQISVPPALLAHSLAGGDHQDRGIGARRSSDHVL